MKYKLLRYSLLGLLVMLCGTWSNVFADDQGSSQAFRNFAVNLVDGTFDTSVNNFGVVVEEDGSYSAAADGATANFTVSAARFNDPQHGWVDCTFTIPVEGPVKVGLGNCQYGTQDGTITDASGNVTALTVGNANCWNSNDIAGTTSYTIYKGTAATTLTIKQHGYCPFISVEKVDPAELVEDATVTFAAGEAGDVVVPAAVKMEVGKTFTLPKNFTMYVEGKTLTAWSDGQNEYAPGTDFTVPEADVTLTPVFTENAVALADRTESVTLKWNFRRDQGAPAVGFEGKDGVWVTQATIGDATIDVALPFTTSPGKLNNKNNNDWIQCNQGTTFTLPAAKGAVVSLEAYYEFGAEGKTATTIDGQSDYTVGKTISYTLAGSAETVDVVIGNDAGYLRYVQVVLPVVEQGGGQTYENTEATIAWAGATTTGEAAPAEGFKLVSLVPSDNLTQTTSTVSAGENSGVTFLRFNDDKTGGNVQWIVQPTSGLTFTPTHVSGKVARFGTDAITINIDVMTDEGKTLNLAEGLHPARDNKTQADDKWGSDAKYATHFSYDIPATFATQQGFTLKVTIGGKTDRGTGFADIQIDGLLNGTVANVNKYTLTTQANPVEGGQVSVYPNSEEFDEGTEVQLTATKNFGYKFVNWTDADGNVVSEEAKFKYTMEADVVLTANFEAVNTYELALTVDGTNDYMVTVNPAPTEVDGKMMYEEGTAVRLTAQQYEGLVTFNNWSDGETSVEKLVSMTENKTLTAYYSQADILAGWDFYVAGNSGRKADFASIDNEAVAFSLVNTETGEAGSWLDKSTLAANGYEGFKGAAVNWHVGQSNGDVGNWHWQTKVNAGAFTNIKVQSQMLYNYNAYQTYNVEYSLDGEEWVKFGSITMSGAKSIATFAKTLPSEADNKAELFIRWIADKTSNVDGTASPNDGNAIAMVFITGTPNLVNDGQAPVLVSTVPADGAENASATGKIVLTFDERVKVVEGATATLGAMELTPTVNGKTVTFEYKGLEYATTYTFALPENTIGDLTDNMIAEPISVSFTTMNRPSVEKGLYDAVVETTDQLVQAIKDANSRSDKNVRYRIFVKNGTYQLPTGEMKNYTHTNSNTGDILYEGTLPDPITYINASNISFIGESREGTIITNTIPSGADYEFAGQFGTASVYDGIGQSDVLQLGGSVRGTYFQDITIKSGMIDARGRNIAVQDRGSQTIYKNACLWGYQDTWTSNNDQGYYYFEGGLVRGRTDFLCGKGDAFFNAVDIQMCMQTGGYIAVPSNSIKYGYVFKGCTIKGENSALNGKYTLGRPWGKGTPVALWIDTRMEIVPSAVGWSEMSNGWPKRFAEYNSTTASGSVVDLSGRKTIFAETHENNPVLTAEEALEAGNLHNMYGEWDPTLLTEQAPIPGNVVLEGNTLTWDNSNYALLYAIVKDGSVVDFTTDATYTIDTHEAEWSVRAANEMGGLGEAAKARIATGIVDIEEGSKQSQSSIVYDLQGRKMGQSSLKRGIYIVNGKKVTTF